MKSKGSAAEPCSPLISLKHTDPSLGYNEGGKHMAYEDDDDPSTFECPNCGERVYIELFACPNCGLVFSLEAPEDEKEPEETGFSFTAALLGWLVSTAVAFLVNFLAGRAWTAESITPTGRVILVLAGPLGALAGGYLAGVIARRREALHGLVIAALSLVSGLLFEAYWRDLSQQFFTIYMLVSWALMLGAGPLGGLLARGLRSRAISTRPRRLNEHELYRELLVLVRFDHDTAERLIAYEQKRHPNAKRALLIQNAIERWEHDNR
jgi:putative membrane protein (TIGR04086 family)